MPESDVEATVLSKLPRHAGGLSLEHNPHKANYETPDGYVTWRQMQDCWVSDEQRDKAIAQDDFWECQWYPDTPVGFCVLFAADLGELLDALEK